MGDHSTIRWLGHNHGVGQICRSLSTNALKVTCGFAPGAQILEYHVIPGMSLLEANLTDGQLLATSLGQSLKARLLLNPTA